MLREPENDWPVHYVQEKSAREIKEMTEENISSQVATEQNLKEADTLRQEPILRQEPSLREQSIEKKRTQIGENSATDSMEMTKEIRVSGKCKETDGIGEEDELADIELANSAGSRPKSADSARNSN